MYFLGGREDVSVYRKLSLLFCWERGRVSLEGEEGECCPKTGGGWVGGGASVTVLSGRLLLANTPFVVPWLLRANTSVVFL